MGGQGAKAGRIGYCDNGTTPTLKASPSGGNTVPDVCYPINTMVATRGGRDDMRTCFGIGESGDPQFTISAAHEHGVCYAIQGNGIDRADTAGCNGCGWRTGQMYTLNTVDRPAIAATVGSFMTANEGVSLTLMARDFKDPQIVCYDARGNGDGHTMPTLTGDHENRVTDYTALMLTNDNRNYLVQGTKPPRKYIVRRLTPTECARLQGFPDWWTDGVEGSDSAKYKMWGNGIALPCAVDVLNRIIAEKEREQDG